MMWINAGNFFKKNVTEQLEFLESETFGRKDRQEQIDLLKSILRADPPPRIAACALARLENLQYRDRYFFRRFLLHPDSTVMETAKHAVNRKFEMRDNPVDKLERMLREGKTEDRLLLVDNFLQAGGALDETALVSFLSLDDIKVREALLQRISASHELDEERLIGYLRKGVVWYVRSAVVEILGKRKSLRLLSFIDELIADKNVEVKLKLIEALVNLGMEQAQGYIERLSRDNTMWVRRCASRALQHMQAR